MAKEKKELAVVIVEATGLAIYTSAAQAGVSFQFSAGIMKNLQIADSTAMNSFIASICTSQKLAKADIVCVFGQTLTFEKQIPILAEDKLAEEVQKFHNLVPFDWVAVRAYKVASGNTIVAINRDIFDLLKRSFETQGARVISVVPQLVIMSLLGKQPLGAKTVRMLLQKEQELEDQSLVIDKNEPKTLQEQEEYISKRYSGPIVVAFILFLVLIFGITAFILRTQSQGVKTLPTPAVVSSPIATASATLAPAVPAQTTATPSAVTITIVGGPQSATESAALSKALVTNGFTNTISKASSVTSEKPLVLFKTNLPASLRTQVSDVIRQVAPDFSVQESDSQETDVWITL